MNEVAELKPQEKEMAIIQELREKRTQRFITDNNKVKIKEYAEFLMMENHYKYDGNFLYKFEDGVYRPINDLEIRRYCQRDLNTYFKKSVGDEIVHYIKVACYDRIENANTEKHILNVKNGLLDWKKRELYPHSPDYFTTIQIPLIYKPEAINPVIETFLRSIVPDDSIETVYQFFGYSLIPYTKFEKAMMLVGEGSNGKSKFIDLYETYLGKDNVSNIPLQALEADKFKLAQIHGKLANTFADIPAKSLETSNVFKTVVSGDGVSAEFKGKDSFNFRPYAKLLFSANELPHTTDVTDGFFRKWIILPFNNKFGPGGLPRDPNILEKITTEEELSGLLNRALDALDCIEKQGGFTLNQSTIDAVQEYKRESNNVVTFVEERCIISAFSRVTKQELYDEYVFWCDRSGYKSLGIKKFYKRVMAEYNLTEGREYSQPRHFSGIGLLER